MGAVSIISSILFSTRFWDFTHLARDTPATRNAAECWKARPLSKGKPKNNTDKNIDFIVQEEEHRSADNKKQTKNALVLCGMHLGVI